MTFKQLQYFLTIAKTGNMSRAAEELNVSQPPLSYQIKSLEEELGCPLFTRSKKGMILSDAGMLLADRASEILELVEKTTTEIKHGFSSYTTPIRVGAITSVSSSILPEKLLEFNTAHPEIDVQIYEGGTTDIINMLNNDKVDIGITREPFNTAIFSYIPLNDKLSTINNYPDSFVVLANDSYFSAHVGETINLSDLDGVPILIHRYHEPIVSTFCKRQGFTPNVVTMSSDVLSLIVWAHNGRGVALMPLSSAMLNPSHNLRVLTIVNPVIPSRRYVLWKKGSILSAEASDLVKLMT